MSRVDEEIREDLARLTQPVRTDGVMDHLARRKAHRRVVWQLQAATLATVVVVGTAIGLVGLNLVFARHDVAKPGGEPSQSNPMSNPTGTSQDGGDPGGVICDESQLHADVDGDGALDQVAVWSPATRCDGSGVGQRYVIHVSGGKLAGQDNPTYAFYGIDQDLPECTQEFACRLFAAPDLNGDGTAELAVQVAEHGTGRSLVLYRSDVRASANRYELVRIGVAAPGDPWSSAFGIPPGPATFGWGDSADERQTLSCDTRAGERLLVVTTSLPSTQRAGAHDVHQTRLRLEGETLTVVDTNDQVTEVQPPMPDDLCGARIHDRGAA